MRTALAFLLSLAAMGLASPGSASSPLQLPSASTSAPMFVAGSRPPDKEYSPEKWGLVAEDFSRLSDHALLNKAGFPGRLPEATTAAMRGDVYASLLVGTVDAYKNRREEPNMFLEKAAREGLVRAIALQSRLNKPTAAAGHQKLREMAMAGNLYSLFNLSKGSFRVATTDAQRSAARELMIEAARRGYVDAQVQAAAWDHEDPESTPAERASSLAVLRKHAALGHPDAAAYVKNMERPAVD